MSRRRSKPTRRGYVLAFIAMLMFAFFALAALVIDMGMVRLTQRQMQSATDSAALEGLRFRDGIPPYILVSPWFQQVAESTCGQAPQSAYNPYDPDWAAYIQDVNSNLDTLRRLLASQMVSNIFDDDLNPSDTDISGAGGLPGNWGAGPVVNFSGGVGSDPALAAGQLLRVPPAGQRTYNPGQQNGANPSQYDPLQTNLVPNGSTSSQEPYGDMVSGKYAHNSDYDSSYGSWSVYPWEETAKGTGGSYDRRDFVPTSEPDLPGANPDPAFLVRMRRLNPNDFQPGIDNETGVSTSGPPLPFLFARGSMMHRNPASSYSPREDGLTVRATSVASVDQQIGQSAPGDFNFNAGRAKTVGAPVVASEGESTVYVSGASPFVLYWSSWHSASVPTTLTPGQTYNLLVDSSGYVRPADQVTAALLGQTNFPIGYATSAAGTPIASVSVGQAQSDVAAASSQTPFDPVGFVSTQIFGNLPTGGGVLFAPVVQDATVGGTATAGSIIGFGSVSISQSSSPNATNTWFAISLPLSSATNSNSKVPNTVASQNASAVFAPFSGLSVDATILPLHEQLQSVLLAPALLSTNVPPPQQ